MFSGVVPVEYEAHRRVLGVQTIFLLFLVLRRLLLAGDALVDEARCGAKFLVPNFMRLPCIMRRRTASHCTLRRIRTSKRRYHDDTSKIPCFYTNTVEIDACLVRDDVSRAQCSARLPRIAYS